MSSQTNNVFENWPKWKIALLLSAPVVVGAAGVWWYSRRNQGDGLPTSGKAGGDSAEASSSSNSAKKSDPNKDALAAKIKGNTFFKDGKYKEAIEQYSEAIKLCPPKNIQDISTFYQNRAAAYEQLKKYDEVIADCSKALEYNNKYVKALYRRAKACETTNNLPQCLQDVTAACILEHFKNPPTLVMAERVLKDLGKQRAKENYPNREPTEPSHQFVRSYFSSFTKDPILKLVNKDEEEEVGSIGENEKGETESPEKKLPQMEESGPFQQALEAFRLKKFADIIPLCCEALQEADSPFVAEIYLLRGSFYMLAGEGDKAVEDFDKVLNLPQISMQMRSNALIKRGSLKLQNNNQTDALDDFATAVRWDPENSDIYHHRGQLNLLIDRVEEAIKDFEKSVSLNPKSAVTRAQKCYTEYRMAFTNRQQMQMKSAMEDFEKMVKEFPGCTEGYALIGQALGEQERFDEADDYFEKAIKLEPDNGNVHVHRGLLQLQWKQDLDKACDYINKALDVDSRCEFAYETLGTIEVQRGNLPKAIELFRKAIKLVRTEVEMAHLYALLEAAIAQEAVARNFGIEVQSS